MTVSGEGEVTSESPLPGLLITIVEDNPLIRQLMAEEIEDEGHRVSSFNSAEDFLAVASNLKRVVVVTALNDPATRQQALDLGAEDYILKPDLFERLPQLLGALKKD